MQNDVENNVIPVGSSNLVDSDNDLENYTVVEINKKIYAIETNKVILIEKMMELDTTFNLPSCVIGFIKYNDSPIGVIDLRKVLGEERIVYDTTSSIILIKDEDITTSIVVDKVIDIKRISKYRISPIPYSKLEDFWQGLYIEKNENCYIISPKNLVNYINHNHQKFASTNDDFKYVVNDDKSKLILNKRKQAFDNIQVNQEYTMTPLYDMGVSFSVNNIKYYINMASVKEFYKVNNSKFIKVPNTPDYIFGLINIKGEYIVVIDIRSFYTNSKTEVKEKSTIILLDSNEYKVGILADEILESMNLNFDKIIQNKIQKQDDSRLSEFVHEDEIYQIIDVEKLLKDDRLTLC